MIIKNIQQALIIQRQDDKIVKIFNNKFAIIKSKFTNGKFDDDKICFLNNNTIYFYPANVKEFKDYFKYIFACSSRMDRKYLKTITQAYLLIKTLPNARA